MRILITWRRMLALRTSLLAGAISATVRTKARTMQLWAGGTLKNFSSCCAARDSLNRTHVQCFPTRRDCCVLNHTLRVYVIASGGDLLPTRPQNGPRSWE